MRPLHRLSILLFLVLLAVVLTTCAKDNFIPASEEGDTSTSVFNLKEETLVLNDATNEDIRNFDPESGQIVYNTGSLQLDSIEVGSVILSRPNNAAAGGFLRKVTSRTIVGNRLLLETEPANLPDAFTSYRWRLNGDNGPRNRMDPTDPTFSYGKDPIVFDTLFDLVGVEDWKFKIEITIHYTLNFRTELDFNLGLTSSSIDYMAMGIDQFSIDSVVFINGFIRENSVSLTDDLPDDLIFQLDESMPDFKNLLTIPLPRFPIDPPTSLVWVEPQIRIDAASLTESSIQIGNRFVFGHEGIFKGLARIDDTNGGELYMDFDTPTNLTVAGGIFFEGMYKYQNGLSIGIGLSPYSRNLFTVGGRVTAGPYVEVTGNAAFEIGSQDGLTFAANASLEAGLNTSAGLFLDADFFGLAPSSWDIEQTLWSNNYALLNLGIDSGCGLYFHSTTARQVPGFTEGIPDSIKFSVTKVERDNVDTDGTYEVFLDGVLVSGPHEADGKAHTFPLPDNLVAGEHTVRFFRASGNSILPCDREIVIEVTGFGTSSTCGGIDQVLDPRTNTVYCVRTFGPDNDWWFANNLLTLTEQGDAPACPDNNPELCEVYGGLYDFNTVMNVTDGVTPESRQGLCPEGYHVPSVREWANLFGQSLPADFDVLSGSDIFIDGAAGPFKAEYSWGPGENVGLGSANGFDALAAGWNVRVAEGLVPSNFREDAVFWTSDFYSNSTIDEGAWTVRLERENNVVTIEPKSADLGASCRCVRD